MTLLEKRYITTRVTGNSLVGVGKQRPTPRGNYCTVADMDGKTDIRVLNMWAENIRHADLAYDLGGKMMAYVYDCYAIVVDHRIVDEGYFYNKLCTTGCGAPPVEVMQEFYDILGDPTNEMERYSDPVSYYAKQGGRYDPKTGWVTFASIRSPGGIILSGTKVKE